MRRVWVFILLAVVPAPASAERGRAVDNFFKPTTRPVGRARTVECRDKPVALNGARGEIAERLRAFDSDPAAFSYTIQLVAEEEAFRVYRVIYPSPLKTPWAENNVVPAEFYVPRNAGPGAQVPAAVVLDILDGSAILPRMMARAAAQNGLAALYVPMPCYNERRPPDKAHERLLRQDPARAADGLRQTVMDVRRAKAILASRPEIDGRQIGITGISLGGIMTALAAGVDGEFTRVVPVLAGGDVAGIMFHCHEMRKLRAMMTARGMTRDDAAVVFAPVEPLGFASRIEAGRCLMINATDDEVIPKQNTEQLARAIGNPQVFWLRAGHYSALSHFPQMQRVVIDFLRDGTRPPRSPE